MTNAPRTGTLYLYSKNIKNPIVTQAKNIRDSCMFVAGVLPEATQRVVYSKRVHHKAADHHIHPYLYKPLSMRNKKRHIDKRADEI